MDTSDLTEQECDILVDASTEIGDTGKTTIPCPRCGGKLESEYIGSSFRIFCTQCGIELGSRGI